MPAFGTGTLTGGGTTGGAGLSIRQNGTNIQLSLDGLYNAASDYPVGTLTFTGATFASLGITPTDVTLLTAPVSGDTIRMVFVNNAPPPPPPPPPGATPIPEPASLAVIGLVGLAAGGRGLRRRRQAEQ